MFWKFLPFLILNSFAQGAGDVPVPDINKVANIAITNKVTGLELTPDITVDPSEGFVFVNAKCNGKVTWLVVTGTPVKYVVNENVNQIIVAVPPVGQEINVFCVGYVENKFTDFARTIIKSGKGPQPPPVVVPTDPVVNPPVVVPTDPIDKNTKFFMTMVYDMNKSNPQVAQLVNNESFRKYLNEKNAVFRVYDVSSPVVTSRKLDQSLKTKNLTSGVVISNQLGQLLYVGPIPKDDKEAKEIFDKLKGT
jgi:hypothetical protein